MKPIPLKYILEALKCLPPARSVNDSRRVVHVPLDCPPNFTPAFEVPKFGHPKIIGIEFIKINNGAEWALVGCK